MFRALYALVFAVLVLGLISGTSASGDPTPFEIAFTALGIQRPEALANTQDAPPEALIYY